MRAFLIDSENVNFDNFIKRGRFKKKDNFFIVGNATLKFSLMALDFLQGRRVKFYDFNEPSKDYADKIILTLLGFLLAQKRFKKCLIVSNDNIFSKLNFTREFFGKSVKIVKINNEHTPKIAAKTDYHIQLFEKNAEFIRDLRLKARNLGEFHRALQKHFKIHGTLIYKYLKDYHKDEFFAKFKKEQAAQPRRLTHAQSPKLLTHSGVDGELGADFKGAEGVERLDETNGAAYTEATDSDGVDGLDEGAEKFAKKFNDSPKNDENIVLQFWTKFFKKDDKK